MKKANFIVFAVLCALIIIASFLLPQSFFALIIPLSMRSESHFFNMVDSLALQRKAHGYYGRYALIMKIDSPVQFIIVSNLLGDYASFERILEELKRMDILSQELLVKRANTYLILNGNIIGDSPASVNVLTRVVSLLKADPKHVIYIRGLFEDKEYWVETTMGRKLGAFSPDSDRPRTTMRTFFNTLPLGLYVFTSNDQHPVRISFFGQEAEEFMKMACAPLQNQGIIKKICSLGDMCSMQQWQLSALIDGQESTIDWQAMQGLAKTRGRFPRWHIVSSPALFFKERYQYLYDAFAILSLSPDARSTITLYHRKPPQKTFTKGGVFDLLSVD